VGARFSKAREQRKRLLYRNPRKTGMPNVFFCRGPSYLPDSPDSID
jgi:hypothetical protein